MRRATIPTRTLTAILGASAILALAWMPRIGLGQQKPKRASEAGGVTDLLKAEPFDLLTLIDNTVFKIEPITPRPLPAYDPAKDAAAKKPTASTDTGKPAGKGAAPAAKKKASTRRGREEQLNELVIHLMEPVGEIRDFKVRRGSIKKVEYYEDMLLAEGERLVQKHDYARAFEHYIAVQVRDGNWRGLREHVDDLLFREGAWALVDNDRERGIRLLRELNARRPDFPGLAEKLADAYGARISEAFEKGSYRHARRVMHDLESIAPTNPLIKEARDKFIARAKQAADRAAKEQGPKRLDDLVEALQIWPKLEGADQTYAKAFGELPTLDVAVLDVPKPIAPWVRSPAGERVVPLVFRPILASIDEDAVRGRRTDQLAEGLESADLGRRLELRLKPNIAWSDGSRKVSAIDVVRALSDRAVPRSPAFNARWADLLERVEISDERLVTIRLARAFLKPEAYLTVVVGPAHASWDGRVPTADGGHRSVGDGPFVWEEGNDQGTTYRSAAPAESSEAPKESEAAAGPKIRRLREHRMPTAAAALGALIRGEVSMVEHVPADRVLSLSQTPEIEVGRYKRSTVHIIALDGRTPVLRNRSLRRALSNAIDRKGLLEETVIRRAADPNGFPADGPFATDVYANAPDVPPLGSDPLLARMLVAGARKEMGGNAIKLTFEYPAIPEAQAAAPKIAEALKNAGIELQAIERPETDLEQAIRAGRRFDLAYRVVRSTEPVFDAGPILCPGYDAPPESNGLGAICSPRMLQLLLQLEHAPDWQSARALTVQIDREARDELSILPLWQLTDHYAWRDRVKGPGEVADSLYQGIEQWEVEPWFAKDPW